MAFYPTFMDEPDLRQEMTELVVDRTIKGMNLKNFMGQDYFSLKFNREKEYIQSAYTMLKQSVFIPNHLQESIERMADFRISVLSPSE